MKGNPYGSHRVIFPEGLLPQAADKVDNNPVIYDNEILITAIGFRKNDAGRYEMDLTDFFKEPCKHSPND